MVNTFWRKRYAKSEVLKLFREIQNAATKEKTGAVQCVKCRSVIQFWGRSGTLNLSRHFYKFSACQNFIIKHLHPPSLHIPQNVKDETNKACISLCYNDIRQSCTEFGNTECNQFLPNLLNWCGVIPIQYTRYLACFPACFGIRLLLILSVVNIHSSPSFPCSI